ncbi:MAG: AmmeMemoRadiSam system protein A [Desulforhopalus sp.]
MDDLLGDRHGQMLLRLARKAIAEKIDTGTVSLAVDEPALSTEAATFVTLKLAGELRGCIGNLEPVGALWEGIRDNAVNAAFHDHRFSPLTRDELPAVEIDISILSSPKPLEYEDSEDLLAKLRPDVDGVILRYGRQSATFLPQVWRQLPSPEQFLGHLCRKAGLAQDFWHHAKPDIETYQVQSFEEKKMKEVVLSEHQLRELEDIYDKLQQEYERVAGELNFSCTGCPDNCCDSYFLHHTYAEWAHLWEGIRKLEPTRQQALIARATSYLQQCEKALETGKRPQVMCPLNEGGLCVLYHHRLLVCRTHGVPAIITRPDGQAMRFPGCFRCQEIVDDRDGEEVPYVKRTALLRKLALLENELLHNKRHLLPKVKITIAEMLVKGPPTIPQPHCEKEADTLQVERKK